MFGDLCVWQGTPAIKNRQTGFLEFQRIFGRFRNGPHMILSEPRLIRRGYVAAADKRWPDHVLPIILT